jgi:hypothetical protein
MMVCDPCANALHADCVNVNLTGELKGTWCDCQHRQSAIHRDSIVNGDRSTIARLFNIPEEFVGDPQAAEEATEESETQSG